MKHTVLITDHAAKDLQGIFDYIANDLMSRQSAFGQLERLTKEIESLDEMPERYHKYTKEPWTSRNLRVMPVDNYLVFYIPNGKDKTVTVIRVRYGRRDIDVHLKAESEEREK